MTVPTNMAIMLQPRRLSTTVTKIHCRAPATIAKTPGDVTEPTVTLDECRCAPINALDDLAADGHLLATLSHR